MATCPNKSLEEWKSLVVSRGEDIAHYLWDKHEGTVPEIFYQKNQNISSEGKIASEKTVKDLAARISNRIGIPYKIISDRTEQFKGKIENGIAIINLAYATLDTPIHEILGHPIIRSIKNGKELTGAVFNIKDISSDVNAPGKFELNYYSDDNLGDVAYFDTREEAEDYAKNLKASPGNPQLYQNLVKELDYGKGKEVLDRIKRDYAYKETESIEREDNEFGFPLNSYVAALIESGLDTETITKLVEEEFPNVDAEFVYNQYIDPIEEYYGNEKPTVRTTIKEVYKALGKETTIKEAYTLEEQQEEAIVELLGMMTANKLDSVKDGKLISLLKRLLKEMKQFVKNLIKQKEVEIDKLPDNMTLEDLSNILAYSNSKLILPGYKVEYTTPDNMKFETYSEASNHVSQLAKNVKEINLDKNSLNTNQKEIKDLQNQLDNFKYDLVPLYSNVADFYTPKGRLRQNYWARNEDGTTGWTGGSPETLIEPEYDGLVLDIQKDGKRIFEKISKEEALKIYNALEFNQKATVASRQKYYALTNKLYALKKDDISSFIDKNKEYEQSKDIIEDWKKVNNIQYNPEEIYSRGQEFSSVVGAYSSFDINLMMQNLLQHIEDNKKAGGSFAISAYTKPVDKKIGHLEGGGGKIKFKIYPKSEDILWAANTDVYSGSVWDASEKVNKDKKSELLGVSYTKYPSLRNLDSVQPNLASIVDDLAHHHNELGIALTGSNFRLEYDENIPYQTKKIIDSVNSILDQKYGKLVKPEIKNSQKEKVFSVIRVDPNTNEITSSKNFKTEKETWDYYYNQLAIHQQFTKNRDDIPFPLAVKIYDRQTGIQPTQTKDNTNSIFDSKISVVESAGYDLKYFVIAARDDIQSDMFDTKKEAEAKLKEWNSKDLNGDSQFFIETTKVYKQKEYTSQAEINTKIAALKEVAKAQPRSLIRSEVVPTSEKTRRANIELGFEEFGDELPFQKIPSNSEEVVKEKTSPELIKLMKEFIKQIGVDYKLVDNIVINGVKQDANGVALIMQKLIQVVEGQEDVALPEEAMHFAVEIIKQTNPKLYQQLLKEINGHPKLQEVIDLYGNHPLYQKDGRRDIAKLKEEAIAQVLADRMEDTVGRTWWQKILDWLTPTFLKSGFDKASMDVLAGRLASVEDIDVSKGSAYFQLTEGERVFDNIKQISDQINLKEDGTKEDGQPKKSYFIGEEKIKNRVSDRVKEFYEKLFGIDLNEDEFIKAINDLKAEKGTEKHAALEEAQKLFVDPETGLLREEALDDYDYVNSLNNIDRDIYIALRDNLRARLNSFPPGTRFMSEVKIADPKRSVAGTIDFLAITPEGKVNILDWKFMDLNTDKYEDVPWYKVKAWDMQMTDYKNILISNYKLKNEDFQQTRMIPILAIYTPADYINEILPRLKEIKIGDVNVQNITEDYLLPVGITQEKTGNKKIDSLIEKLNNTYKKLSEEKVTDAEKANKAEQLNSLYKAIRHLQIKQNIVPLINQAKILNKQVSMLIDRYKSDFEGKENDGIPQDKINAFAGMIRIHLEALAPYLDLRLLRSLVNDETEEGLKLKTEINNTLEKVENYISDLQDLDETFGTKFNEASTTSEKVVKGISKWLSNMATLQIDNIQSLYKKANKAFALAEIETLEEVKQLTKLRDDYQTWASSKGLSVKNYFDILMKKDKNELIDEFDKKFYDELKAKIAKKDHAWVLENIDQEAYRQYVESKIEEETKRIFSIPRVGTVEEAKAQVKKELAKLYNKYDLKTRTSNGWLIYDEVKKFPNKDKWTSKEWVELNKPENDPAKKFYDYIIERNKYYAEIGYLEGKAARKFLPWIRKGFIEGLAFDGATRGLGEQFLRNISMDESEAGYGQTDPTTGELINVVPRYFTKDFGEGYSTDLFKTMALYNQYAIKFKNLKNIEESALQLLRIERNKKSIMTSRFGRLVKEGDEFKYVDNSENSQLLEDMIKAVVYQQKYIESEVFDAYLGKISGFGKNINDKLGMKIFPENLEERQLSANKLIDTINSQFQLTTLGLNSLSAISNLFGGTANGIINAGKYFTKLDYIKTQMWMLTNKMQGTILGKSSLGDDPKKAIAALDYFLPFIESYNRDAAKKLSLNKFDEQQLQDFLMFMMRSGEHAIQTLNFFAFLKNAIVVDGKIVNVREYLRSTDEYKNFYAGTQAERKERRDKFDKDVETLIDEKGVLKLGEIKDGEFVIPGVDKKSDSVIEFRRLVQSFTSDALGSMSEENRRKANMNVYASSIMVFKNWIPRLVDVRIGNMKYNAASDAYEWGRIRMLFGMLTTDIMKSINSTKAAIGGDGDVWLDQVRDLYEKKRKEYKDNTGKDLDMTEDEFISLVNQNIKNQVADLVILLSLMSLLAGLKAAAPDDDEDAIVKNQWKFYVKATDKLTDELMYFYDPTTPFDLLGKGIVPSLGLLENYIRFTKEFALENFGMIVGDEEIQDDAKPIKYLMKSFPIANQAIGYLPMFYPDLAKDLGIKMQGQYGMR